MNVTKLECRVSFVGNFQWNLIEQEVRDLALNRWRHTSTMMLLADDVQPRQILRTNRSYSYIHSGEKVSIIPRLIFALLMTTATPSLDIQFSIYCSSLRNWYPTLRYAQSTLRYVKHSGVVWHESINKNTHQTITTKWNKTNETVNSTSGSISLVNFPWTVYRLRSQRIISNAICRTIVAITGSGSMKTRPLSSKGLIPAWRASRYPYYHPADSKWANRNCIEKMYTCPASVCPAGATICIRVVPYVWCKCAREIDTRVRTRAVESACIQILVRALRMLNAKSITASCHVTPYTWICIFF